MIFHHSRTGFTQSRTVFIRSRTRFSRSRTESRKSRTATRDFNASATEAKTFLTLLPFDPPQRHQPRHLAGEAGLVDHIHNPIDVLVGVRGLLGELSGRGATDDDPLFF